MRRNSPQLDRTMPGVYQDEPYNPAMQALDPSAHTCASVTTSGNLLSPHRSSFSSLLQQANNDQTGTKKVIVCDLDLIPLEHGLHTSLVAMVSHMD